MLLSHDEINTLALLIERKPEAERSPRDNALYDRVRLYFAKDIGVIRMNTDPVDLQQMLEDEKDIKEEKDHGWSR